MLRAESGGRPMARAMTERSWLAGKSPERMLAHLREKVRDRSLWLFTVACFTRKWESLPERVREAMEVTARYAEGRATDAEMLEYNSGISAIGSAEHALSYCRRVGRRAKPAEPAELQAQVLLLREVFGNPFRPVTLDPAWLTSTVVTLAQQMYDANEFGAMPILGDALQDAGCDNAAVLDHCRDAPAPHVRGCWVLDLVLRK